MLPAVLQVYDSQGLHQQQSEWGRGGYSGEEERDNGSGCRCGGGRSPLRPRLIAMSPDVMDVVIRSTRVIAVRKAKVDLREQLVADGRLNTFYDRHLKATPPHSCVPLKVKTQCGPLMGGGGVELRFSPYDEAQNKSLLLRWPCA